MRSSSSTAQIRKPSRIAARLGAAPFVDDFRGTKRTRSALGRGRVGSRSDGSGLIGVEEKCLSLNEGLDFLGSRMQRCSWLGRDGKDAGYSFPPKKSLGSITEELRLLNRRGRHRTTPLLRRWYNYFGHAS